MIGERPEGKCAGADGWWILRGAVLELTITLPEDADRVALLGAAERNIKLIRQALGVSITARDNCVRVSGEGALVNRAAEVIADLTEAARLNRPLSHDALMERINRVDLSMGSGQGGDLEINESLEVYARGHRIGPKTKGQMRYLRALIDHDMVFCTGPAGTGKTYLAVAAAVTMLKRGEVKRLVLVRPAVEAGEKIGFLPGDMQEKVNPYLRPLLDAMGDMMSAEQVQKFVESGLIEIVPLAFMRGRTLNDAAVILDEAQNTTGAQMLMFLTRMGNGSKMIVVGDMSQTDLEGDLESGLSDGIRRLSGVAGIAFVELHGADVVRHTLVHQIVEAYEPRS